MLNTRIILHPHRQRMTANRPPLPVSGVTLQDAGRALVAVSTSRRHAVPSSTVTYRASASILPSINVAYSRWSGYRLVPLSSVLSRAIVGSDSRVSMMKSSFCVVWFPPCRSPPPSGMLLPSHISQPYKSQTPGVAPLGSVESRLAAVNAEAYLVNIRRYSSPELADARY